MAKIAISSDWHNKPFREEKFKSQKWSVIEWFISLVSIEESLVRRMILFLSGNREIKTLILGGDLQENSFNERGMITDADVVEQGELIYYLEHMTGVKIQFNAGNHELGYDLPLSSDEKAGISTKSVQNFLRIAKREKLLHAFSVGGKRFILVPYLFSEEHHACWVINLQKELLAELKAELEGQMEPIVLILHDFDSLKNNQLARLVRNAHRQGKVEQIFCGHNHASWGFITNQFLIKIFSSDYLMPFYAILSPFLMLAGVIFHKDWMLFEKIRKYYATKNSVVKLAKTLKPTTIPAPDGLFGFGGGVLVYNTESGKVVKKKI